jgi:uncharacterized protein
MKYFLVFYFFALSYALSAQNPEQLLLKDYRPVSIYKTTVDSIAKPSFPVIDMHSHAYAENKNDIDIWLTNMDYFNVQKTILLTYAFGQQFDSLASVYKNYGNKFELWCGIDFRNCNEKGWAEKAAMEIERCYNNGARGIGEIHDKGAGLQSGEVKTNGLRADDARMNAIYSVCAKLNMPLSMHIAEPKWMYQPMDSTNDGFINSYTWRVDSTKAGMFGYNKLILSFENAVKNNPKTTFIACHFLNCETDLSVLGKLFDELPNLFADIAARYSEIAPVPRYAKAFIEKYNDRLVFGTDMGFDESMYKICWRILESNDEHFYEIDQFGYHWALHGLNLSDETLKKLYYTNPLKILKQ